MPNLDINFASVNMAGTQKPPCHGLRRLFYTATTKNTIFINHQKFHYHEKSNSKRFDFRERNCRNDNTDDCMLTAPDTDNQCVLTEQCLGVETRNCAE